MSKTILRQLFEGEIYPSESIQCQDPRYHDVSDSLAYEKEHFYNSMSENDCARFKQLDDLYYDAADIVNYDRFAYGFRLGALSVCEGMSENGFMSLAEEIINQIANMAIPKPPNIRSSNPEYEVLTSTIADEREYFLMAFCESDRGRFGRLDALYFDVNTMYGSECFIYGYRLGISLLLETLGGADYQNSEIADES